jgi:DNA repair exonuclease SbcCD ATPase subunit
MQTSIGGFMNVQRVYEPIMIGERVLMTPEQVKVFDKTLTPILMHASQSMWRLNELAKERGELAKEHGELAKERGELVKERGELDKKRGDLDKEICELGQTRSELDKRNSELDKRNSELDKRSSELTEKRSELTERRSELTERRSELTERRSELTERRSELTERRSELTERRSELTEKRSELEQKGNELNKTLNDLNLKRQELVVKQFYSIFHGKKPVPPEEISILFQTYLAQKALTFEQAEGKNYPQLNSMPAVTKYLTDRSDIKSCDFRVFETHVAGIPILAEYLKKSSIKAVAFNENIPSSAKADLAEAVAARKGGLKVQYFP